MANTVASCMKEYACNGASGSDCVGMCADALLVRISASSSNDGHASAARGRIAVMLRKLVSQLCRFDALCYNCEELKLLSTYHLSDSVQKCELSQAIDKGLSRYL
eukprot:15240-Heterococcus_DN1.PRE.2